MSELQQILAEIESSEASSAARRRWNPEHQGRIDIRIATDGSWYHDGRKFQRQSLVKLFAGVLRREDSDYYLVTPAEKLRLIEEAARSLRDPATSPSAEARRDSAGRLRRELADLPVHNPADGFSNRDHDEELYGGRS